MHDFEGDEFVVGGVGGGDEEEGGVAAVYYFGVYTIKSWLGRVWKLVEGSGCEVCGLWTKVKCLGVGCLVGDQTDGRTFVFEEIAHACSPREDQL